MNDLVSITDLTYRRNWHTLLNHLDLQLASGHIVGLLGANGAGKTTLMRLIAGLSIAYKGTIAVAGVQTPLARKTVVSSSLAIAGSPANNTIDQLATFWQQSYRDFDAEVFAQLASALALPLTKRLSTLSKGNRAKLELALCLSRRVPLYLLDEPFDGIDSMTRKKLVTSMINWLPEQATILISDHHVTDIAPLLDEVVVIKERRVIAQALADDIRAQHQSLEAYYEGFYQEEAVR